MSLKSVRRQGRSVWGNWTKGRKSAEQHYRQQGRKEVRELKRLTRREERRRLKRLET